MIIPTVKWFQKSVLSRNKLFSHRARRLMSMDTLAGPLSLDTDSVVKRLQDMTPSIVESLTERGYYTTTSFIDTHTVQVMRDQAIQLYREGRYEQSWSESIVDGRATRFDKPGVFACEPDGSDYETAPDLISYMSALITSITIDIPDTASISNESFNAKLAVTQASSEYPLHVDNSLGVGGGDMRKLTCILYLNPGYEPADRGELRLHLMDGEIVDLDPGTRFVCFWTDEIPHKVMPTGAKAEDRYALTIWLADRDPLHIHNPRSKFCNLRLEAFS
jgi:SM-20-related protein